MNTPVPSRLWTILFTPNAPVNQRWKTIIVSTYPLPMAFVPCFLYFCNHPHPSVVCHFHHFYSYTPLLPGPSLPAHTRTHPTESIFHCGPSIFYHLTYAAPVPWVFRLHITYLWTFGFRVVGHTALASAGFIFLFSPPPKLSFRIQGTQTSRAISLYCSNPSLGRLSLAPSSHQFHTCYLNYSSHH